MIEELLRYPNARYVEYHKFFKELKKNRENKDINMLLFKFGKNEKYLIGPNIQIENKEKHKELKEMIKYSSQVNKNLKLNSTRYLQMEFQGKVKIESEEIPCIFFLWNDLIIIASKVGRENCIKYKNSFISFVELIILKEITSLKSEDHTNSLIYQFNKKELTLYFNTNREMNDWQEYSAFWTEVSNEYSFPDKMHEGMLYFFFFYLFFYNFYQKIIKK